MSFLLAALLIAQQPIVVEGVQPAPVAKKKAKQKCETIEVSGSRMPKRVCRDVNGDLEKVPGVTDTATNAGMMHATPGAAQGGLGGVPQ
jgi:hypothetical protein